MPIKTTKTKKRTLRKRNSQIKSYKRSNKKTKEISSM